LEDKDGTSKQTYEIDLDDLFSLLYNSIDKTESVNKINWLVIINAILYSRYFSQNVAKSL